jgi:hypothetical protein
LGRPCEHEARLKEVLVKRAQLNAVPDLDKHEAQVIAEVLETDNAVHPDSRAEHRQRRQRTAGWSWLNEAVIILRNAR